MEMKRAFSNLDRIDDGDEEARGKVEYQSLLLNHLQLQNELISKKGKLYKAKQKRETLLAEVGFLRQRHKYLLQIQSEEGKDDRNQAHGVDDVPSSSPESNPGLMIVEEPEGGRDREKLLVKCRTMGKSKISWPNKMSLETIKEEEGGEQEKQNGNELLKMGKRRSCWTDERLVGQIGCL